MDSWAWFRRWLFRALNCHHLIIDSCLKKCNFSQLTYFCAVALFSRFELFCTYRQMYVKYSYNVGEVSCLSWANFVSLLQRTSGELTSTVCWSFHQIFLTVSPCFIYLFVLRLHSGHHNRLFHIHVKPFFAFLPFTF